MEPQQRSREHLYHFSNSRIKEVAQLFEKVSRDCAASVTAQGFLLFYYCHQKGIEDAQAYGRLLSDSPEDMEVVTQMANRSHDVENQKRIEQTKRKIAVKMPLVIDSVHDVVSQGFSIANAFEKTAADFHVTDAELEVIRQSVVNDLYPYYIAEVRHGDRSSQEVELEFWLHVEALLKRQSEEFAQRLREAKKRKALVDIDRYD